MTEEGLHKVREHLKRVEAAKFNSKMEQARITAGRKWKKQFQGVDHPVLGKHVASIPLEDHAFLLDKYGHDGLKDREFLNWLHRRVLKPEGLANAEI